MEYRFLWSSGLKVSSLAFGALTFGGTGAYAALGTTRDAEADRIVGIAIDGGVTLLDTSNSYSDGESEKILGNVIRGRRQQIVLAGKVSTRMGNGPNDVGLSRA